jgi:mRNA interferase YafQ|tara:strand:+ start:349 stop:621 length:273 start_codon:yes stop_codon:yes gene_type:complete
MTSKISQTTAFKKDLKRQKKRGKDLNKLQELVKLLIAEEPLEGKYRDHSLTGNWADSRDCHIAPDWLLIYRIADSTLYLERTGSHSDLFK